MIEAYFSYKLVSEIIGIVIGVIILIYVFTKKIGGQAYGRNGNWEM